MIENIRIYQRYSSTNRIGIFVNNVNNPSTLRKRGIVKERKTKVLFKDHMGRLALDTQSVPVEGKGFIKY